jgi:hypothetical protein
MDLQAEVRGLAALRAATTGDPAVCVAVLDGPVDLSHPCFDGADLRVIDTLVQEPAGPGPMSLHGTHVTNLIFGQPDSPVVGVAPRCRGLILPVFRDEGQRLSQLDLARAIERAVQEGAHVINVSGGERAQTGEADAILENALRRCAENNVLVVAAVGNDGCACLQIPAAVPSVLAVGATDARGVPLASSNWGADYRANGVLAVGHEVDGARPGGGTATLTGSSFATPLVAGVAALLLDAQRGAGRELDPAQVREAILATASPCQQPDDPECQRCLAGALDISAAHEFVTTRGAAKMSITSADQVTEQVTPAAASEPRPELPPPVPVPSSVQPSAAGGVRSACACEDPKPTGSSYVYAIGSIGYDFGTEARRDGFIQQMDGIEVGDRVLPPNPYDPHQMHNYLAVNPWASDKLIWICKLESSPIYALEAESSVGMAWGGTPQIDDSGELHGFAQAYPPVSYVHKVFRDSVVGQALGSTDANYVSRVSVPGTLTNRTVRLYSGQVVPVVIVQAQGLYTWNETVLVDSVVDEVVRSRNSRHIADVDVETVRRIVRAFLDKVYYQFRNLGQSSPDRALNYAATNAFELTKELATGFLSAQYVPLRADEPEPLYTLDDITVTKSTYCRYDADGWDVRITFFDPTNDHRSRIAYLLTVDVSAPLPVSLAPVRKFLIGQSS